MVYAPLLLAQLLLATPSWAEEDCVRAAFDGASQAQVEEARILELLELAPSAPRLLRRPSSERRCTPAARTPSLTPLPLQLRTTYRSAFPDDRNNAALWPGKGASGDLRLGVDLRAGPLSASFWPSLTYQQNAPFYAPSPSERISPYAHPHANASIDLPVRHGPNPGHRFHPGQSVVRVDLFNVALGFSSENLWWGPGLRNALILTNSAPGFPHVFAGTQEPVDVFLGHLEAQVAWGQLRESAWFDFLPQNDRTLWSGVALTFTPKPFQGLKLGAARVHTRPWPSGGLSWSVLVAPYFEPFLKNRLATSDNPTGDSPDNQLTALFARWSFPEEGFEAYFEYGRDDHSWNTVDLVLEPDHSRGFVLGFQKITRFGAHALRLHGEVLDLAQTPRSDSLRGTPNFYTHGHVRQGYTHQGQMLGAATGPGSDNQSLAIDWLLPNGGRAGVFAERTRRNEVFYLRHLDDLPGPDVDLVGGARVRWPWGTFAVDAELSGGHRWNRNFVVTAPHLNAAVMFHWLPDPARPRPLEDPLEEGIAPARVVDDRFLDDDHSDLPEASTGR